MEIAHCTASGCTKSVPIGRGPYGFLIPTGWVLHYLRPDGWAGGMCSQHAYAFRKAENEALQAFRVWVATRCKPYRGILHFRNTRSQ